MVVSNQTFDRLKGLFRLPFDRLTVYGSVELSIFFQHVSPEAKHVISAKKPWDGGDSQLSVRRNVHLNHPTPRPPPLQGRGS